jgi:flagellar hook-associated protein 3 FlgL
MADLQRAMQRVYASQQQLTTGRRVERVSDDPGAARAIMQSSGALRALEQYRRNIGSATARLNEEERVLTELNDMMTRAKELALAEGSSSASATTRLAAKAEIDQLISAALQLGNSQYLNEYLFGGDQSDTPPFTTNAPPFAAAPPNGRRNLEIGSGFTIPTNHNGTEIFLNTGVLASLHQLSLELGANNQTGIVNTISGIDSALAQVQSLLGDVGATARQLEIAAANTDALDNALQTFRSDLQDVDLEKAATDLISRQTAYQSALLATSRILGLSLADYIR